MVKLTSEIRESLAGTKIVYFATASKKGVPNAVPIGAFKLLDDETMLISDQYFNKTLANLKENPQAAVSFWGEKGGFQIKGTVTIHTGDKIFNDDVAWVKELKPNLVPKSAIVLKISGVFQLKPGPGAGQKIL
ncbi:pyridoxamine 5'-phosphate oxidase family protein [Methanoregula sp.]|jgi:predicted pyridoxine 5'-phosphate oxidase superfamily flavin-nucleotide-binding protein|uniref:pyridoxamine 5'-phosphate oxidase family protein n=1 Tax=Methanoregula sp. TaxID=2052170 RepID=UPI0025EEE9EA|nr:pyridoxamine 5'-phosphate oxidase family protein [Methanoregula sp.]